jgi:anti-sigma factor RsiW
MTACCGEGQLRAYLDRELPPAEAEAVALHLAECDACADACGSIGARAARVSLLMEDLSADIPAAAHSRRAARYAVWAGVAAVAAALIVMVLLSRHANAPAVQSAGEIPPAPAAILETPAPVPQTSAPVQRARRVRATPVHRAAEQEYVALDDQPIDTGFVMRLAMPSGALADVIVDGNGHPRAIRPIRTVANFKESQ